MKQALALLAVGLMSVMSAQAQTATDLNEGQCVTKSATTGVFMLSWWGQAGRTYFIQQSSDLMTWQYVPVVMSGAAAVTGMNFSCSDSRQFWRLRYTDAPTGGNAQTADFDLDGRTNQQELDAGTDVFSADTDGDGFDDGTEALAGTDAKSAASNPVADLNDVPQLHVAYLLGGYGDFYYFADHYVSQSENDPALWLVSEASTIPGNLYFSAYVVEGTMPAVPALPARPDADSSLSSWSSYYYYVGNDTSMALLRLVDGDSSGPDFFTGNPVISRRSRLIGAACKYKLTVRFPSRNVRTIKMVEQRTKQAVTYAATASGYASAGTPLVTSSQVRTVTLPANAKETATTVLQPDEADANFRTTATVAKALFITPAGDPVNGPVDAGPTANTDPDSIPDGANEFTFSNATTGVLKLKLKVRLPGVVDQSPADQAKYTFDVDAIGNSVLSWGTDNPGGKAKVDGEYLTATAIFSGLPQNNSDFGSKSVRLKFDGYEVANTRFEVFFNRDATNHPGNGAGTDRNWFYYWGQIQGNQHLEYGGVGPGSTAKTPAGENWSWFTAVDKQKIIVYDSVVGKFGSYTVGKVFSGIDRFFGTVIHEERHVDQIARADALLVQNGVAGTPWRFGWSFYKPDHNHWSVGPDTKPGKAGDDDDGDTIIDNYITFGSGELGKGPVGSDIFLGSQLDPDWPVAWPLPQHGGMWPASLLECDAIQYSDSHYDENQMARSDWGNPGKNHQTLNKWND